VLVCGEIDWELKFTAKSNKASGEICARDGSAVPCIKEEQDCFHSNPDGVLFVGHNFQTFVEIAIDALDQHTIVISTREDVGINLQEVNGFFAYAKEFAILVEHDSVAKAKSQLDFHDTRCKG
jgi:hypothetical protein